MKDSLIDQHHEELILLVCDVLVCPSRSEQGIQSSLNLRHSLICVDCYRVHSGNVGTDVVLILLVVLIEGGLEALALVANQSEDVPSVLIHLHW
jgi:hypothetical protein